MNIKTKENERYTEVFAMVNGSTSIAELAKVADEVRKEAETLADGKRLSDPLVQAMYGRLKVVCLVLSR